MDLSPATIKIEWQSGMAGTLRSAAWAGRVPELLDGWEPVLPQNR